MQLFDILTFDISHIIKNSGYLIDILIVIRLYFIRLFFIIFYQFILIAGIENDP